MPAPTHTPALIDTSFMGNVEPHPVLLTRKATDALITVEHMLDDANHALSAQGAAPGSLGALDDGTGVADSLTDTFAAAAGRNAATSPRGD
jgi:hypothetical protein